MRFWVVYEKGMFVEALQYANTLRASGVITELCYEDEPVKTQIKKGKERGATRLIQIGKDGLAHEIMGDLR